MLQIRKFVDNYYQNIIYMKQLDTKHLLLLYSKKYFDGFSNFLKEKYSVVDFHFSPFIGSPIDF